MNIVVVDDKTKTADLITRALRKKGHEARAVYSGEAALAAIQDERPDVVLTDWHMPELGGMDVLRFARQQRPPIEVIVFTGYGAVETAVQALRMGATDFLTKPVTMEQLTARLAAIEAELHGDDAQAKHVLRAPYEGYEARSERGRELEAIIQRVASAPTPVWIEGELGSGREYVAREIGRHAGPNTPFTVVRPDHQQTWEWPQAGIVLLPQLDVLSDDALGLLASRLREVPPGVRIIATSTPAPDRRRQRSWNEIYYRVAVLVIHVPALRDRREDIVPLFEFAVERFASLHDRPRPPRLNEQIRQRLETRSWPGNIRELFNEAERLVVLGQPGRRPADAPDAALGARDEYSPPVPSLGDDDFKLSEYMDLVERTILEYSLEVNLGDRRAAGEQLGVERNALRYKLKKHGLL